MQDEQQFIAVTVPAIELYNF